MRNRRQLGNEGWEWNGRTYYGLKTTHGIDGLKIVHMKHMKLIAFRYN